MTQSQYEAQTAKTRTARMKWWHEARFGMFIHWGLYSQLGRHEWVMNRECIPVKEYEKLADTWKPKPRPMRAWAKLAKQAGMKYMVMTTKHHEGFCLWDSKHTDYNAAARGPGRDLVKEYVDACREYGLKVGFYYSLMDWHHPDGAICATDKRARKRFIQYTQGLVRELMSNYGKIDILWYDVSWPLKSPAEWDSVAMNSMARELQPHILINNRSQLDEDFGTPEESIEPEKAGRAWEACMTFNTFWGYKGIGPEEDWLSVRKVIDMLRQVTAGAGNLLLNIGPAPDGSIPPEATKRLTAVGKWLKTYGEAIYGKVDRNDNIRQWMPTGLFTRKGNTGYFWSHNWPGEKVVIGGLETKAKRARLLSNGKSLRIRQESHRLFLSGLPKTSPDKLAHTSVIKVEFASEPKQKLGAGCVGT